MHFVLVGNCFINERQSFITRYYRDHPSEYKSCQLLQCFENSILNNLSKFLFHACIKERYVFVLFCFVSLFFFGRCIKCKII